MAQDKKGFILYADQKSLFYKLPNDKAGELIKHIFSFINDENPTTDDLLIEIAFEPIKQQLKRDLKKFESAKKQRSEAGKRSAELRKEQRKATPVEIVERKVTKSTVKDNVKVNDNVNDNVILLEKETKEIVFPFQSENFIQQWQIWKRYKKEQHKFTYKSEASEQAALTQLQKMATNRELKAIEIIHHTMANGWKGFVEPKTDPRKETQEAFQAVKDKINFDFSDGKLSFER